MKIKGILFDFDGVLAETMQDLFNSWRYSFYKFGVEIKKEDYFPLEGMEVIKIAEHLSRKYSVDIQKAPEILRLKNEFYLNNHSFRFYKGVERFIELLNERKTLIGLVSASPKEKLEKTVPKDFLEKFNVIISGDDLELGKPNPDPYLTAARKLNLDSSECLVVENAPLGIKSAKNANMKCIAIESTLDKSYLNEADLVLENFKDLFELDLIKELLKG